MRVVLDTNVIVSGLNFPGNERLVLELARRGRFDLCLSPFILEEVAGVLAHKFGWDEPDRPKLSECCEMRPPSLSLNDAHQSLRVIRPTTASWSARSRPPQTT